MTLFAVGRVVFGVLLALSGVLTLAGRTKPGPAWLPIRLSGAGQLGFGVFLFLTGAFPGEIWAFVVAVGAFVVSVVCVLVVVVKWVRGRAAQDWPG